LFYIPQQLFGYPLFGMGLLLAVWAVVSIVVLAWLIRKQGLSNDTLSYIPVLVLVGLTIRYLAPGISEERGLPIRGYGVMLVVAVLSGVALGLHRAKRMGVSSEVILSLAFWLFVAGIIGGRLFFVVQNWDQVVDGGPSVSADREPGDPPEPLARRIGRTAVAIVSINNGGLVVYGALIGGGLSLIAFVYRYRIPGLALADLIAPSVVLGMALGRIGCFLNGCCFGDVCDLPWAVTFPKQNPPHEISPAHEQQILLGQIYGLTIGADSHGAPIIVDIRRDIPAAATGLKVTERIDQIGGQDVATLDDAQRALMKAYLAGGPLQLGIHGSIYRLMMLPGALEHSLPVHPTQIYSTIDALLLCLFLIAYYPYRRRDGELAAITMIFHPISRYLIEIIRNDESPIFGTGLTISQNISLGILFIGVGLWIYISRKPEGTAWPTAESKRASPASRPSLSAVAKPA
jgi:phosphatidylglycerol:prolipoprotein diacylglycerol transferase